MEREWREENVTESKKNRYEQIIERIFLSKYKKGLESVDFDRAEITEFAKKLKIELPKNLGDLVYTFRYRSALPQSILKTVPKGKTWIIRPAGRSAYRFSLVSERQLTPNENLAETKVPDATPSVITRYSLSDEQALLAKVRYNRLVDIFTGVTCYSLQNHLRTTVPNMGQVETDELYVGIDKRGSQYVFPVQAKAGRDKLNIVQIEQDLGLCSDKFPELICRPLGTQFMANGVIAMFEFEESDGELKICAEKHYRLVPAEKVTHADLKLYRDRTSD
jgi:hypothetical protein